MDFEGNQIFCQEDVDCPSSETITFLCLDRGNPNFGLSNYDNIFFALLTTFEVITLEQWTEYMYMVRSVYKTYLFDIYFVITVQFGAFLVLNLMIAVQF
jgi:hypothetical protein